MIDFYIEDGTLYRMDDTPIRAATAEEEALWQMLMRLSTHVPRFRPPAITEVELQELLEWKDQPGQVRSLIHCPSYFVKEEK